MNTPALTSERSTSKTKVKKRFHQNGVALFFLLPWLIGLLFLTLGPMLSSLYYSFTDYSLLTAPKWIGTENYKTMFTGDPVFINSLKVTFIFVVLAVPIKLIFSLLVALILKQGMRGLGIYRTVYYIPSLLGGSVAVAMLWRQMFGNDGLLNQILHIFGIDAPNWVGNPNYALYTIVILYVWQFGSSMIIFLAGLKQIPTEYYEASAMDGAGKFRQFFSITLPGLSPILFFNLVMQTIMAFQSFTPAFVISGGTGGPVGSTMMYSLYLYQKGFAFFQMGYASAMAWVLVILISIFTLIIFRSSKSWVHYQDGGK
jgi:multiple sugar transport system permease protein